MKMRLMAGLLISVCLLCLGCKEERKAGEVPFLSLQTYSGKTYTVSSKDKQVTLLVFWATWCRPCLMEIPILIELEKKYGSKGFRVVGVNVDDPDGGKALPILERFGVNYATVIGTEQTTRKFGGIHAIPTSFIIGRDGMIKEKIQGLAPPELLEEKVLAEL